MKILSYFFIGLFLISCSTETKHNHNEHDHDEHESHMHNDKEDEHDHELNGEIHEEHETEHATLYTNQLELFVEYSHPEKNEDSDLNIFVTKLENYKPLLAGKVVMSFQGDQKTLEPSESGIFKTVIQPKEAGEIIIKLEVEGEGIEHAIFSLKMTVEDGHLDEHEEDSEEAEHVDKNVTFLKQQAWNTDFSIQKIHKGNFFEVIHTSGQILPSNEDEKIITSLHAGLVSLKDVLIEGNYVTSNEVLLELSGKGLAEDNMLVHEVELKTNYELAESNYKRLSKLSKDKIVSERELLEAKAKYEQAKVAYENFGYQTLGDYFNIKASSTGFVKNVFVKNGQFVEVGAPLFSITKNKKLILQADVSQKYWPSLPFIKSANIKIPNSSRVYTTRELSGNKISYGKTANSSSWSTPVFFELKNQGELIPGTYVEVFLETKPKSDAIAIPVSALIEEQGNLFVFVQKNGELYEKRLIKTGVNNGREIEVLYGLAEGEMIVSEGAYQIKLASMSSAIPAHNHQH